MILINLMPHRKWALAGRQKRALILLACCGLAGLLLPLAASLMAQYAMTARAVEDESWRGQAELAQRLSQQLEQLKTHTAQLRERESALHRQLEESAWRAGLASAVAESLPATVRLSSMRLSEEGLQLSGEADTLEGLHGWLSDGLRQASQGAHPGDTARLGAAQWQALRSRPEPQATHEKEQPGLVFSLRLPRQPS